jgi:excisionase family DNA binding protein
MRRHEGQLSLFEANDGPTAEASATTRPHTNGRGSAANEPSPSVVDQDVGHRPSKGESAEAPVARIITGRPPPKSSPFERTDPRGEALEKHYKTRDVAELLSVHEETVLRLAQCGNLRSVRVGSERRYPESAIVEFLERNVDDTASRVSVPLRRARSARRRRNNPAR